MLVKGYFISRVLFTGRANWHQEKELCILLHGICFPQDTAASMDEEPTLFIYRGRSGKRKIICDSDDVDEGSCMRPTQNEYALDKNKVCYATNMFLQHILHEQLCSDHSLQEDPKEHEIEHTVQKYGHEEDQAYTDSV